MNIKHLIIYITIQVFHYIVLGYYPSIGAEISMLANETLKNSTYSHYENPKPVAPSKSVKSQESGTINYDLIRNRIAKEQAQKANKDKYAAWKEGGIIKAQEGSTFHIGGEERREMVREYYRKQNEGKQQAEQQQAIASGKTLEQAKANILIFGTIGLASLFFIIAIIIFYVLYKRNNNLHINQNP